MRQILRISLLAILALVLYKPAFTQVAISVDFGPPALPVYEQPPCPEDGWLWVPGYWAWDADDEDYYWVPGTWVAAPEQGYLWTPPWWGWDNGAYLFHDGYWATDVGFYGGVDYGFGYSGHGFDGGRWDHDRFFYNTAVVNVNRTVIRNVYEDRTVVNNNMRETRVSYNGGEGGIQARPTTRDEAVVHERHVPPPAQQEQRREIARSNPQMRASANQGKPPVAATERPTEFTGHGAVAARSAGAPYHPPANRQGGRQGGQNAQPGNENARPGNENARPGNENQRPGNELARPGESNAPPTHARDLQPHQAPPPPEGGNSAANQKYQQQQQQVIQKQNQEHQRLAQQQQQEDQRVQQQHNQQKQQQVEQKHQQQTQQLEQKHQQQQQKVQQRQPQPKPQPKSKERPQN